MSSPDSRRQDGPEEPSKSEFDEIEAWLDRGLRRGERGRLAAEYPLSFHPGAVANQRVIRRDGSPAAHAMLHEAVIRSISRELRVGMIGLVYTDPEARGQGLATRCVESCIEELGRRGVPLALLWSEKHAFYARMDFRPVGSEWILRWRRSGRGPLAVGAPRPSDWERLERLHARKPVLAVRPPGALERLARAPDTHLVVARSEAGEPVAYAVAGRGDDFEGCVHEWAGLPDGVVACIDALHEAGRAQIVLAGPEGDPAREAILRRCPERQAGIFALGRVLDEEALRTSLIPGEPRPLSHAALLGRIFGLPGRPDAAPRPPQPPPYLWGLDSV